MRKYTRLDLIRFHKFANEPQNAGKNMVDMVTAYNLEFPEKSLSERWENMCNALNLPQDHPLRKRQAHE